MPNPQSQVREVEKVVERPTDEASRSGRLKFGEDSTRLSPGKQYNTVVYTNNSDETEYLEMATVKNGSISSPTPVHPGVVVVVRQEDSDFNDQRKFFGTAQSSYPMRFTPAIPHEPDWHVSVTAYNPLPVDTHVSLGVHLREEIGDA